MQSFCNQKTAQSLSSILVVWASRKPGSVLIGHLSSPDVTIGIERFL